MSVDISLINSIGVSVCSERIILPGGQKETDFSLPALIGEEYTLVYTADIDGISQQHISDAKITYSDTIYTNSEEVCGIVLEPMYRETVSGTITLPNGLKAPDGGYIKLLGWDANLKPMLSAVSFFE